MLLMDVAFTYSLKNWNIHFFFNEGKKVLLDNIGIWACWLNILNLKEHNKRKEQKTVHKEDTHSTKRAIFCQCPLLRRSKLKETY